MTHSGPRTSAVLVRHVRPSLRARWANFAAPIVQAATALIADTAIERGLKVSEERQRWFRDAMRLVAFLATASCRAANGNNDRLSTPWREMISLAGVARSHLRSMVVSRLWVRRPTRAPRLFDVGQGSGFGLGQVQRFVQESGGAVEIKSEVGSEQRCE
jgi:hypothetical protein